jgi:hypothetical protein
MSVIGLRFRGTAARLKVLTLHHPSLAVEQLQRVASEYLPDEFIEAARMGADLDDPYTLWELFAIDAVISLEDIYGYHHRVAVSLVERENKAYRLMKEGQTDLWIELRGALGINRYWVFSGNFKHLSSDQEWVDILYSAIDRPCGWSDCRLINL